MPSFEAGKFIWRNGLLEEVNPQSAIHLPLLSQALDYARTGISGIRVTPHFEKENTLLIFSLEDHIRRLFDTCHRIGLEANFTPENLRQGAMEVVQANAATLKRGGYMRIVAYDPRQVIAPQTQGPAEIIIFAGPFGEYVPAGEFHITFDDILRTGSQREAKVSANYVGFAAAKRRVQTMGMNDVIGVTSARLGKLIVGEGTTSSLFLVYRGHIYTPATDAGILFGITRMRVIELAKDLDYQVSSNYEVPLSFIPVAEEMFLTGTASYVVPITHFGIHPLETEVGKLLNRQLRAAMEGQLAQYSQWNTEVLIKPSKKS